MSTVIISGALANKPFNGGNAWSRLSWALGFRRLGFKVCFVEQVGAQACVDVTGAPARFEDSVNLRYFQTTMETFGFSNCCSLVYEGGKKVWGVPLTQLTSLAREACLVFNFSGHLTQPEIKEPAPCKVYYDDDPGYTQFWHASGDSAPNRVLASELRTAAGHRYQISLRRSVIAAATERVAVTG